MSERPSRDAPARTRRSIPPLVWIIVAALLAWFIVAKLQAARTLQAHIHSAQPGESRPPS